MFCEVVNSTVLPSPVKAMLAVLMADKVCACAHVVTDSFNLNITIAPSCQWTASPRQASELRMALTIDPPSADFWLPISQSTMDMAPRDKVEF